MGRARGADPVGGRAGAPGAARSEGAQEQARRSVPNALAGLLSSGRWRGLIPLVCPDCHTRVTTVAAGGSPVLVRHEHRYIPEGQVERVWCRRRWVAVVEETDRGRDLRLVEVSGREQQDRVLQEETERWGRRMVARIARAVQLRPAAHTTSE